jgi:hypothetical protein
MAYPTYIFGIINADTEASRAYRQIVTVEEDEMQDIFFKTTFSDTPKDLPNASYSRAGQTYTSRLFLEFNEPAIINQATLLINNNFEAIGWGSPNTNELYKVGVIEKIDPKPVLAQPKPTPEEVESKRLQEAQTREQQQSTIQDVDTQAIDNATPQDSKPQGSAKLGTLVTEQGKKLQLILIPAAIALVIALGAPLVAGLQGKIKEKLNPNDSCPDNNKLNEIITKRNALVNRLNRLYNQLNRLTQALVRLSTFLSLTIAVLNILKRSKTIISLASKFIPSPPGVPGAVTSATSDLDDVIRDQTFTSTGSPKLEKVAGSIAAASLSVALINGLILTVILLLRSIDAKIQKCDPYATLTPINSELIQIADLQQTAEETQNQTTYKGFIIDIEIIPYTSTVTRRRARGLNQDGIVLIQTELSFTTVDEVLINELKFIIDRDNLKAY